MHPTLVELGPWDPWVASLLAVIGAAVVMYADLRSRETDEGEKPLASPRAVVMGLIGACLGVGVYMAVNHWGPVKVRSWGTMLMVGFGAAMAWAAYDSRDEDNIGLDDLIDLTIAILIGAIVGARVVSAVLNWSDFAGHPEQLLRVWEGGLSFHGGLIGGWIAGSIIIVRRRLGYGRMVALLMPSIALGYAITRIGCFLNGCCYGVATDLPWGVCFHELPGVEGTITRHPTQLYASAANIGIFFLLLWIRPHLRKSIHMAPVYLGLYSVYRFLIEILRRGATAQPYAPIPALTQAQAASIAIFTLSAIWLIVDWIITRPRAEITGAGEDE